MEAEAGSAGGHQLVGGSTQVESSATECAEYAYGATRLVDHKIRRRITFALLTFRRAYLIFRTFIVKGQFL